MKRILITLLMLMGCYSANCQQTAPPRVSFTVHGILQAFKVPFSSPSTYLHNKGLSGVATYSYSGKAIFQQNLELGYFFNRYQGNTFLLSSSAIFNPIHAKVVKAGIGLGAGYMNSGFSEGGWVQQENGEWTKGSNRRGNLFIPANLHIQVKAFENAGYILSPVLAYQVNALIGYSHAATVLPQSIIKVGLNLSLK